MAFRTAKTIALGPTMNVACAMVLDRKCKSSTRSSSPSIASMLMPSMTGLFMS